MRSERFAGEARRSGTSRVTSLNTAVTLLSGAGAIVVAAGLAISHAAAVHRADAQAKTTPAATLASPLPHPRTHPTAPVVLRRPRATHRTQPGLVASTPKATQKPVQKPAQKSVQKPVQKPAPQPPPVAPTTAPPTAVSHGS